MEIIKNPPKQSWADKLEAVDKNSSFNVLFDDSSGIRGAIHRIHLRGLKKFTTKKETVTNGNNEESIILKFTRVL